MPAQPIQWLGARELKQHTGAVIERVQQGERFVVTHHGTPVAVLAPVDAVAVRALLERMADEAETIEWLHGSAAAFTFWDNPDDAVWDTVAVEPRS